MKTIGLITSGKTEAFAFLKYVPNKKKLILGQFEVYYFKLNGYEIFLLICNKQLASARHAATLLIEKISPLLIISFGIAGAVEEDIRVGDMICGNSTTMIENGIFEQYIGLSGMPAQIRNFILNRVMNEKERIFLGTIITVSGDQDFQYFDKIRFNHPVLDMETLGVAQATLSRNIPMFSLRGVTHNLAVEGNINIHTILDFTFHYKKRLALRRLFTSPFLLTKFIRYYKTKNQVSNQVARMLYSLLEEINLSKKYISGNADYQI